jgi:hypothetical protein
MPLSEELPQAQTVTEKQIAANIIKLFFRILIDSLHLSIPYYPKHYTTFFLICEMKQ